MWVHKMYKKDEKVESVVRIHVRGTTGDGTHVGPLTARVARAARATYDEPPADVASDEFFTRVLDLGLPGRLLDAVLLIGTLLTAPLWRMRFFAHLGHWRAGGMELECAAIRRALQGLVTKSKRLPAQSHAVVAADLPALAEPDTPCVGAAKCSAGNREGRDAGPRLVFPQGPPRDYTFLEEPSNHEFRVFVDEYLLTNFIIL